MFPTTERKRDASVMSRDVGGVEVTNGWSRGGAEVEEEDA